MYFGTGIVKTAENFGSQGEPTEPSGTARLAGDRVRAHRLGCEGDAAADRHFGHVSAEFADDSELLEKDPENRLLRAGRVSVCCPK